MEIDPLLASGRSHNGNQSLKVRVFPNSGANSAGLLPGRERKAEQTSELMDRRTGKNGKTQSKSQNGHFWSGQCYALDEIGKGNAKSESNAPREQKNHNGTAGMAKNTSGELDSKVTKGSPYASATADSSHHQSIMTQCRAVCLAHSPEPSAAPKHYNNTGIVGAQNSALPDSHQKMLGPKSLPKNGSDPRSTEYTYVKIVEDSKADALEFEFVPGSSSPSTNSPHIPAIKATNAGTQNGRQVKKAVPRGLKKHIVQSLETPNGQEFRRNGGKFGVMTLPSPAMLNNQLISVVHFKGTRYPPSGHLQTPLTSPRFHTSPPLGTSEMRPPTISPTVGTASQNAQQVPIMQQHGGIQPGAIQSGRQQQIQIFGGPQPVQSGAAISQVQHQQFMRMPFIGHETQLIAQGAHGARYSPEICLAGCVFLIIDDFSPSLVDRNAMCSVIRFHGGDVEQFGMRGIPDRVTHLVCSTVAHSEIIANQATIERRKRLVTIQWLSETIMNKRMDAPTKPCHLPTCWAENSKPAVGKLITVAGFDDVETSNLKWMISAIGARYTPTLTAHNQILISKGCSGSLNLSNLMPKIEKAKQLGVAVVNFQWIVEQYFGNTRGLNDLANPMYSPMNALSNFENCSSLALERMFDFCAKLLFAWKFAIPLNEEIINMALELKKNVENDKSVFPHRQFKCSLNDAPSEEQIAESLEILKTADKLPKSDVLVYFEGLLPLQIECMSRKIRFLGGKVAESVEQCTHFVVPNLERTAKLVEALAMGKAVISPEWIQNCFSLLKIVDAYDFFVRDIENERKYGYNLKDTILKARYRRVFEDVTFHLSANVRPTYEILSQLIIAGGGRVEKERPTKKKLAKCIEVDDTYLIVVNESDLHLYQYLITCNFPLFTEDFVWMSIIRHKMDFTPTNYMIPPQVLRPHLSQTQPAILAQAPQSVPNPTPAKKSGGSRPGAIKQERISLKAS